VLEQGADVGAHTSADTVTAGDGWSRAAAWLSLRFWPAFVAVCLLGLAMRLPTLSSHSLWIDETYSAWFSGLPLRELWTSVPLYETHPPMYYTLLKGWRALFGASEAGLRGMSVLASVLTIAVLASSGRALRAGARGDVVALLAALFLSVNAGNIDYAQQCRPYALETLGASIVIVCALRLLQKLAAQSGPVFSWAPLRAPMAALGVAMGITLWLHNTAIFIAFGVWVAMAVTVFALIRGRRVQQLLAIGLPGLLALLLWSPFVPMFIKQNANMATMSFWVVFHRHDLLTAWYLIGGGRAAAVPLLLAAAVGLIALWRSQRVSALGLAIILLLPLGFVQVYSFLVKAIYIDRLFEWMAPAVLALAATGVVVALSRPRWRAAGALLGLLALGLGTASTLSYYAAGSREDWRGLVASIAADARPDDVLITVPNELNVPLKYYADPAHFPETLYMPAPFPARGLPRLYVGNMGAPTLLPSDIELVRAALRTHKRVWLLQRYAEMYDPKGMVLAEVQAQRKLVKVYNNGMLALYE
jgi:4-amino-4-deoxy-L-arabinose transferase-like glycosyltransferase